MTTVVLKEKLREVLESSPPQGATELTATLVADTHCILGECVIYDDETEKIVWTDIEGKSFYRLSLSGDLEKFALPKMLGAFALTTKPGYLCAWEDGFNFYDIENNKELSEMSQGEAVNPLGLPSRLNDGRCDENGRYFICGGHYGGNPDVRMKVYKCFLDPDTNKLAHDPILDNIKTTNSICFSPGGNKMFFSDSPTQAVDRYAYDQETGTPSFEKQLWKWPEKIGDPDGSCNDVEGYVWNTLWRKGSGTGRVHRIDPETGKVVLTVHLPDTTSQGTCCCLGGKDMDVLFISTASIDRDLEKEPNSGALYAVKVGIKGRKESRFQA